MQVDELHQHRVAIGATRIGPATSLEHRLHDLLSVGLDTVVLHCQANRRSAVLGGRVRIGAGAQQRCHGLELLAIDRPHQRSDAVQPARVDLGPGSKRGRDAGGIVGSNGLVKRGLWAGGRETGGCHGISCVTIREFGRCLDARPTERSSHYEAAGKDAVERRLLRHAQPHLDRKLCSVLRSSLTLLSSESRTPSILC